MLTKKQKDILLKGEKNSRYRKELSIARKKAIAASEDLEFLSKIDPKTRKNVIEPMLLSNVKSCLKFEKTKFPQPRRIDGGKIRLRKGLPYSEKKQLEADGEGELARSFDGKVMVQLAGALRNSDGSPIMDKSDYQKLDLSYKMLEVIYQSLKEQCPLTRDYEPNITLTRKDDAYNLNVDYSKNRQLPSTS